MLEKFRVCRTIRILIHFLSPVRVEIQVKTCDFTKKLDEWLGADSGSMQRCGKHWRREGGDCKQDWNHAASWLLKEEENRNKHQDLWVLGLWKIFRYEFMMNWHRSLVFCWAWQFLSRHSKSANSLKAKTWFWGVFLGLCEWCSPVTQLEKELTFVRSPNVSSNGPTFDRKGAKPPTLVVGKDCY